MQRFIILQKEKKNGVLSLQRFMDQKAAFFYLLTGKNTSPKNFKCQFFFLICHWIKFARSMLYILCLTINIANKFKIFCPEVRILTLLAGSVHFSNCEFWKFGAKSVQYPLANWRYIDTTDELRSWSFLGIFEIICCESEFHAG